MIRLVKISDVHESTRRELSMYLYAFSDWCFSDILQGSKIAFLRITMKFKTHVSKSKRHSGINEEIA